MVVDASVVVKWFFPEPGMAQAQRLLPAAASLAAPDLLPIEVGSALTRRHRRREMQGPDVLASMHDLQKLGIRYVPASALLSDALAISLANRHGMLDCLYLALAQRSAVALATFDARLAALAGRLGIQLWTP